MALERITIERFSITSAKQFAEVISAIEAQVGHPDMTQFYSAVQKAEDDEELQRVVESAVGPTMGVASASAARVRSISTELPLVPVWCRSRW